MAENNSLWVYATFSSYMPLWTARMGPYLGQWSMSLPEMCSLWVLWTYIGIYFWTLGNFLTNFQLLNDFAFPRFPFVQRLSSIWDDFLSHSDWLRLNHYVLVIVISLIMYLWLLFPWFLCLGRQNIYMFTGQLDFILRTVLI